MSNPSEITKMIAANAVQIAARRRDLRRHNENKCSCPNDKHPYRCDGHKRAIKGIIDKLGKDILVLRQAKLKALRVSRALKALSKQEKQDE